MVPVFNQVHLTERCLGSLLDNSILARELVVIDNKSNDSTPAFLKGFQKQTADKGWSMKVWPTQKMLVLEGPAIRELELPQESILQS